MVEADNKTIKEIKSGVGQSLYLARRRKLQFHWREVEFSVDH